MTTTVFVTVASPGVVEAPVVDVVVVVVGAVVVGGAIVAGVDAAVIVEEETELAVFGDEAGAAVVTEVGKRLWVVVTGVLVVLETE